MENHCSEFEYVRPVRSGGGVKMKVVMSLLYSTYEREDRDRKKRKKRMNEYL